jgi:CO/xanthine dehydrogenase FAD-binding subunit
MISSQVVTRRLTEFKYLSPKTIAEAVSILEEYHKAAKILAGGTDLLPMMKLRAVIPEYVVSLNKISGLNYILENDQELRVGALTKISTILASELIRQKYISIHEAAMTFATPQVRSMATLGGNICRSSPSADMVPPLISLGTHVILTGPKGTRKVLLEDFFTGAGQTILEGEILTEVIVSRRKERCSTAFAKMVRNSVDLAKVNCAVALSVKDGQCVDIVLVLGAVADRAVRAKKAEQAMKARKLEKAVIEEAARRVAQDITPITDVRSTAEYRLRVSQVLAERVIKLAVDRFERRDC